MKFWSPSLGSKHLSSLTLLPGRVHWLGLVFIMKPGMELRTFRMLGERPDTELPPAPDETFEVLLGHYLVSLETSTRYNFGGYGVAKQL